MEGEKHDHKVHTMITKLYGPHFFPRLQLDRSDIRLERFLGMKLVQLVGGYERRHLFVHI
jgi:hypothetical protein